MNTATQLLTRIFTETSDLHELGFMPNGTEAAFLDERTGTLTIWTKGSGAKLPDGTVYLKPADLELFA